MPVRTISCGGRPSTRFPRKTMRPESGAKYPVMRLKAVVFPAPLLPMRLVIVPALTPNDRLATAVSPPKLFDRSSISRTTAPPTPAVAGSDSIAAVSFIVKTASFQYVAVFPYQALSAKAREEYQKQPVQHLAQLRRHGLRNREEFEYFGQNDQHSGGEDRAIQVTRAADNDQRDDEDGLVQRERNRIDGRQRIHVHGAGRGGEHGRKYENRNLDAEHVLAKRRNRRLVLAHRAQQAAERRSG